MRGESLVMVVGVCVSQYWVSAFFQTVTVGLWYFFMGQAFGFLREKSVVVPVVWLDSEEAGVCVGEANTVRAQMKIRARMSMHMAGSCFPLGQHSSVYGWESFGSYNSHALLNIYRLFFAYLHGEQPSDSIPQSNSTKMKRRSHSRTKG